jgi:protein-tyrosine phosphatase|tara:strand:- start:444 stop:1061 length:618 start_codon:yes stop_codon:yes gene_type:complete
MSKSSTSTSLTDRAKAKALKIQKSLDSPFNEILPFLYLGSDPRRHSKDIDVLSYLKLHKFTHRIDLTTHPFESPELTTRFLTVPDDPSRKITLLLFSQLEEACNFIDQARQCNNVKLLIHCKAGVSRSATLVIYYLLTRMYVGEYNLAQILEIVRQARPIVSPNHGFMHALCDIETNTLKLQPSIDPTLYKKYQMGNPNYYRVMQ